MFKGLNTTIEIKETMKQFVETLFKNNVVDEHGKLNPEKVKILSEKYGNRISLKDQDED